MTESIQKKLLRVRPPRVKITYDVETGGAIEKKELPFIVGIFADLAGDREDAATYPALKTRRMVDIDCDNFNDLMATIKPRVAFAPAAIQSWAGNTAEAADKVLTLSSIDAFEPLNIVNAMPSLSKLYTARSQIRSLQAKAESDDTVAKDLDAMVQDQSPVAQARHLKSLTSPRLPFGAADAPAEVKKLIAMQESLAGADAALLPTLKAWHLIDANHALPAEEKPDGAAALDATAQAAAKRNADAFTEAKSNAAVLATALAARDTAANRGSAIDLLKILLAKASATPTEPAAPLDPVLALFGFADAASAKTQLEKTPVAPLTAAIATPQGDRAGDALWALPLLMLGVSNSASVRDPSHPSYLATLGFVKYLSSEPVAPGTAADLFGTAQDMLPLIKTDTAKSILALQHFTDRLRLVIGSNQEEMAKKFKAAQAKGAAAVIDELVADIDRILSDSLSSIMHCPGFKKMEATWRGLHYLVFNTETSPMLRLRVLNADKNELLKDMQKAVEFDQSVLFKKIYEDEYGTYGGMPYSLLIGDYEVGGGNKDLDFLKKMSEVAAAAHAPFIAQVSKELFGLAGFEDLGKPRDLKKIFESVELSGWRDFREMEDARYVTLTLPRALLRLPYGTPDKRNTMECEGLNFNEQIGPGNVPAKVANIDGSTNYYPSPNNENFLWGNPAFLLAERITNAFSLYNWTAAIRGVEGGGLIEGLPRYTYTSDTGSTELFCPTEVSITDRREKELNDLGFISLCHCKGTGKAAFFGGQTTNQPKKYFSDDANANARISAMLPYMLAASRFAHYIKVIMREKIGSFLTRANVESYLNTWISNYVLLDDNATQEVKSSYPLRSARVVVTDVPGEPGAYRATVFLKPHFQLEELTTSIRLVAQLPK